MAANLPEKLGHPTRHFKAPLQGIIGKPLSDADLTVPLGVVSQSLHDMGSPLLAIQVLLELLRIDGSCRQSREEILGKLDSQVTEMVDLLDVLRKAAFRI
jgi:hypothetical protein